VAVGVTEREIGAEAEYAMRKLGSEGMGIDTIVGSGKDNTFAILSRTTNRRVGKGDHILLTLAPRYEGYHAAIGRVVAIGSVDQRIEHAMAVAIEAQDAAAAALRPGASGAEIDAIARDVCRRAGLERHFAYSGVHSVGLAEFEPPILTSHSHEPLTADMILSIDIPIFFAPWGGLRVEDGFLLGPGAINQPLQTIPKPMHRLD
jgi:Xaa-Pro aminopeptidase